MVDQETVGHYDNLREFSSVPRQYKEEVSNAAWQIAGGDHEHAPVPCINRTKQEIIQAMSTRFLRALVDVSIVPQAAGMRLSVALCEGLVEDRMENYFQGLEEEIGHYFSLAEH